MHHDGGGWLVPCPGCFTPGNKCIIQDAGWALVSVWMDAENPTPIMTQSQDHPLCSESFKPTTLAQPSKTTTHQHFYPSFLKGEEDFRMTYASTVRMKTDLT
jgi:hypothetical protein